MVEEKNLSTTVRIDLLPGSGTPPPRKGAKPAPASSVTRMDWKSATRTPEYVSRSRYQELLQSLYDATLVTKLDGSIVDANARASQFLQHEKSELLAMSIASIISGADEGLVQQVRENLERERFTVIQAYCVRKSGDFFPAEIAVSRIRLDEPCLCFFMRDITIRVEAETRVLLEQQALHLSSSGTLITDVDGNIVYANPTFEMLSGQDEEGALVGRDLRELVTQPDAMNELIAAALKSEGAVEMDLFLVSEVESPQARFTAATKWAVDGEALGLSFNVQAL